MFDQTSGSSKFPGVSGSRLLGFSRQKKIACEIPLGLDLFQFFSV